MDAANLAASSSPPKPTIGKLKTARVTEKRSQRGRIRRGMRNEELPATSDDAELAHFDSPFDLEELLAARIRADPHDVERIVALPGRGSKGKAAESAESNGYAEVDPNVWLYEQLRRAAQDLTAPLLLSLQEQCNRQTCPEMKAGEWLYLCAAHAATNEHECCAIDYSVHTLDGATALLNSSRYFPSRTSINQSSVKHFTSIARRLYRIFAHAYFAHRDVFEESEAETSLYARFLHLSNAYGLIPDDLLVVEIAQQQQPEPGEGR